MSGEWAFFADVASGAGFIFQLSWIMDGENLNEFHTVLNAKVEFKPPGLNWGWGGKIEVASIKLCRGDKYLISQDVKSITGKILDAMSLPVEVAVKSAFGGNVKLPSFGEAS